MPSMHLGRMVWQQGQSQAFPEFRTNRMCMRWEDFDDMVTSIQLPEEVSYINGALGSIRLPYLPYLPLPSLHTYQFFYLFFYFFHFYFFVFLLTTRGNSHLLFLVRNKSCDRRTQACGSK